MASDIPIPTVIFDAYLVDATGQPNLVMGGTQSEVLIWTLVNNQSTGDLVVTPFQSGPVSQTQFHFSFVFAPGALTHPPTVPGWDVLTVPDGHGAIGTVYVALSTGRPALRITPGNRHDTPFLYTTAIQENANSTQVRVTLTAGPNVMVGTHKIDGTPFSLAPLTLVQARTSLPAPPLAVDFVGRRTVINDGETDNSFTFALTNMTPADLTLTPDVKFTVWFDAADNDVKDGGPWALARVQNLAKTTLAPAPPASNADWSITPTDTALAQAPVSRHWEISAKHDLVIAPEGSVEFTFSGLKTDLDPGFTRMYLRVVNLPGFRPGVLSAVLEKTPLLYGAARGQGLYLSGGTPTGNVPPAPNYGTGLFVQQFDANTAAAVFNGGPVGIGTGAAMPAAKVQIVDPDRPVGKATLIVGSATANDPSLNFGSQTGCAWIQSQVGQPLAINYLTNSGNVGIGIAKPGSTLSVVGGVAIGAAYAQSNTTIPANTLAVEDALAVGTTKLSAMVQINGSPLAPDLFSGVTTLGILQRSNDSVGLSVRSFGTNPTVQFCGYDKNGQNIAVNYLQLDRSTSDLLIGNAGAQTRFSGNNITAGNITGGKLAATDLALTGGMTIAGSGVNHVIELGYGETKEGSCGKIGYKAFSQGLDIVGAYSDLKNRQIHLWDEVYVHGKLWMICNKGQNWCWLAANDDYVKANDYNWAVFNWSDARLKTNVASLESPLTRLRALNGYSFDWTAEALSHFTKDVGANLSAGPDAPAEETEALRRGERERAIETLARRQAGVIAQEVEAVLPEAVTTGEDGYKSVNSVPLVALLIEAVKEQDQTVTAQAARIDRLERELAELRDMISSMATGR